MSGGGSGDKLGFVDDLRHDIKSYLSEENSSAITLSLEPRGPGESLLHNSYSRLAGWLSHGNRLLCYCRPPGTEAEVWAEARRASEKGKTSSSSSSARPGPAKGRAAAAGAVNGYAAAQPATPDAEEKTADAAATASKAPRSTRSAQPPPWRTIFGAPPDPASLRWPPRPSDDDVLRALGRMSEVSSSPCKADSDSGRSDSGRSADSDEPGSRRARARRGPARRRGGAAAQDSFGAITSRQSRELLEFSSCFESGNLRFVIYDVDTDEYNLILDTDVNSRGHTQWFYFAARNGQPGKQYRLRLVNMCKGKTLFRMGMRPLVWSEALAAEILSASPDRKEDGKPSPADAAAFFEDGSDLFAGVRELWRPAGEEIRYYRTRTGCGFGGGSTYTLAFEYVFEKPNDSVFFAYFVPYTYSMLRSTLQRMAIDPATRSWCRLKCLADTLGEVRCDAVTITNFAVSRRMKKAVIISSRVHPGESNASWIVHGLMGFLLSTTAEAQVLRDNFVWILIPMLNPDGVISGNYRCGLCGTDLNRQWRQPDELLHCSVHSLKKLVSRTKRSSSNLCLYLDVHGHSRKCGIFAYACGQFNEDDHRRFTVRMYPKLLSLLIPEFNLFQCRWSVGKGKRGTGRVVVSKDVGLTNSYTIEASIWGSLDVSALDMHTWEAGADNDKDDKGDDGGQEREDRQDDDEDQEDDEKGQRPQAKTQQQQAVSAEPLKDWQNGVVPFTVSKLQIFGANLARALVLQYNLTPSVQSYLRSQASWDCVEGGPWPRLAKARDDVEAEVPVDRPGEPSHSPCDSGSTTPSETFSDGNDGDDLCGDGSEDEKATAASEPVSPEPSLQGAAAAVRKASPAPPAPSPEINPPPEAASRLLEISTADVLLELKNLPLLLGESDTGGSDSQPSEGNLAAEELAQVGQALRRTRKPLKHKSSGSRGKTSGKRTMHKSSSKKEMPISNIFANSRYRAKSFASRRTFHRDSPEEHHDPQNYAARGSRADLQKVVAFGQTTYLMPSGGIPSSSSATSLSGGGRGSSLSLATTVGPGSFAGGGPRSQWPAIRLDQDKCPSAGSSAGQQEHGGALPGLPRDRFMQPSGCGPAVARLREQRRENASSTVNSPYSVLSRQLHVRHVSTSVLQPRPIQGAHPAASGAGAVGVEPFAMAAASPTTSAPSSPVPGSLANYATAAVAAGWMASGGTSGGARSGAPSPVPEASIGTGWEASQEPLAGAEGSWRPTTADVQRHPTLSRSAASREEWESSRRDCGERSFGSKDPVSRASTSPNGCSSSAVREAANLLAEAMRTEQQDSATSPLPGAGARKVRQPPVWLEDPPVRPRPALCEPTLAVEAFSAAMEAGGSPFPHAMACSGPAASPSLEAAEAAGERHRTSANEPRRRTSKRLPLGVSTPAAVAARAGRYLKP
eukprot:TRINITY_DN21807_c0_g2_i1.p1 TRINITY_DN21807_c0_g2~~TRINITY_DN21807_c0_g2_i1.p1  ORF type:complete len:1414 (+),score=214.08 TRINITY_DN21807_c0_g2_i1:138-4379(+)